VCIVKPSAPLCSLIGERKRNKTSSARSARCNG
jgi:hypothetical protein